MQAIWIRCKSKTDRLGSSTFLLTALYQFVTGSVSLSLSPSVSVCLSLSPFLFLYLSLFSLWEKSLPESVETVNSQASSYNFEWYWGVHGRCFPFPNRKRRDWSYMRSTRQQQRNIRWPTGCGPKIHSRDLRQVWDHRLQRQPFWCCSTVLLSLRLRLWLPQGAVI